MRNLRIPKSQTRSIPRSSQAIKNKDKANTKANHSQSKRLAKKAEIKIDRFDVRDTSDSDASGSDKNGAEDDEVRKLRQLAILEAHSRTLLGLPLTTESSEGCSKTRTKVNESENQGAEVEVVEEFQSDDGWGAEDGFVSDSEDGFQDGSHKATFSSTPCVPEVVFDPSIANSTAQMSISNAERRAFLNGNSSKMMGITSISDYLPGKSRLKTSTAEDLEDANAASLDKTLHNMLLTNLLPSHNSANASRPVDKRNAIQGRLMELANYELPGEGSKSLKGSLLGKHPASIRTGLLHKQQKREKAARQEAIESGSFIKGLGGLGEGLKRRKTIEQRASLGKDIKKKGMESRKKDDSGRERGLGMGIGRFEAGTLKLSEGDVARFSAGGRTGRIDKDGKGKRKRGW
ncbi:uncharacterized protein L203_104747 [Cryptococcus depauperatus CBS 7841]|uniref:Uncharacterized protein n=1 Tax=Cryptococcus depauperatus CBS 7841 TaxID=1295531 RepID=A0A1E3INF2_9TREE|nr:hypothetical protein L203_02052 [Cryptococcus depauperatus CBS 7841]